MRTDFTPKHQHSKRNCENTSILRKQQCLQRKSSFSRPFQFTVIYSPIFSSHPFPTFPWKPNIISDMKTMEWLRAILENKGTGQRPIFKIILWTQSYFDLKWPYWPLFISISQWISKIYFITSSALLQFFNTWSDLCFSLAL